jgi:cellulase
VDWLQSCQVSRSARVLRLMMYCANLPCARLGAYTSDDPSIYATVWSFNGTYSYDNSGKPYVPPGGPVQTCPSGGSTTTSTISSASSTRAASSTLAPSTTRPASSAASTSVLSITTRSASSTTTSTSRAATSSAPAGPTAQLYGQCGGKGWTGATTCASGTCKASGDYYSQCLP